MLFHLMYSLEVKMYPSLGTPGLDEADTEAKRKNKE